MDVLLTDINGRALVIELAAGNTDDGILEILEEHKEELIWLGLTYEWVQEYGWSDLGYFDPDWERNVRVFESV